MLRKVVIPAAGLGSRLLPATKEQPKEMLPVFSRLANGDAGVKPLLQMIFEQLYNSGFREFCFIVGRGKRAIEDHFTPDQKFLNLLKGAGKIDLTTDLESFYMKLANSSIIWINQPEPKGFGDAVLLAQPFVRDERCLVHAGDTFIISENDGHLRSLMDANERFNADAIFLVQEVENPRQYGVIEVKEVEKGIYRVEKAVEKPEKPPTNLAIMPVYIFRPTIFNALQETLPGKGGEIQLTDAIQKMIEWGLNVYALRLGLGDIRLDIGSPETYWQALSISHQQFFKKNKGLTNDKL
ncbi:MAG: UTP--glucose-1-phosphate uridylyltransferase [Candidatus Bathyarchaeia archaeon]